MKGFLKIKPLSANKAWKGRRFKTDDYKWFEKECLLKLKPMPIPINCKLHIILEFGFSSAGSDIDNPEKMTIDVLSKKYGFNDNKIYLKQTTKVIVPKGQEYIRFDILPLVS